MAFSPRPVYSKTICSLKVTLTSWERVECSICLGCEGLAGALPLLEALQPGIKTAGVIMLMMWVKYFALITSTRRKWDQVCYETNVANSHGRSNAGLSHHTWLKQCGGVHQGTRLCGFVRHTFDYKHGLRYVSIAKHNTVVIHFIIYVCLFKNILHYKVCMASSVAYLAWARIPMTAPHCVTHLQESTAIVYSNCGIPGLKCQTLVFCCLAWLRTAYYYRKRKVEWQTERPAQFCGMI